MSASIDEPWLSWCPECLDWEFVEVGENCPDCDTETVEKPDDEGDE